MAEQEENRFKAWPNARRDHYLHAFDELSPLEKAVLEYKITGNVSTAPDYLSKIEEGLSSSTYYRHFNQAVARLTSMQLLGSNGEPTLVALEILPVKTAQRILEEMRREIRRLHDEQFAGEEKIMQLEEQRDDLDADLRLKSREAESMYKDVERFEPVSNLLRGLEDLHVDENWATVVVALTSVELALKLKLERMGIEFSKAATFRDLYALVERSIRDKESRSLPATFLRPEELYSLRSKIDHWGHKYPNFSRDETNFIVRQATDLIKGLFQKQ